MTVGADAIVETNFRFVLPSLLANERLENRWSFHDYTYLSDVCKERMLPPELCYYNIKTIFFLDSKIPP